MPTPGLSFHSISTSGNSTCRITYQLPTRSRLSKGATTTATRQPLSAEPLATGAQWLNNFLYGFNAVSATSGLPTPASPVPGTNCDDSAVDGSGRCGGTDPIFVDPNANDFRLNPSSPAVDAGSDGAAMGTLDLAGNGRIIGTVDVGAYEQ